MPDSGVVIFGGTAAYNLNPADFAEVVEKRVVHTPYGHSPTFWQLAPPPTSPPSGGPATPIPASSPPSGGTEGGATTPIPASSPPPGGTEGGPIWFSSRHGENSLARSARFVNHRANLWAVRALGATAVLSWNGVGAINPELRVGQMVIPAAIMDWTRHRVNSFGKDAPHFAQAEQLRCAARTIAHIENGRDARQVALPFAASLRESILKHVEKNAPPSPHALRSSPHTPRPTPHASPTYVCTEGPRLETAAEIQLAAELGADVVGMTLCPEVWLAAELGLAYASLCLVTNFATGRWHIDPRRDFGAAVAERALPVLLAVAQEQVV